MPSDPDKEFEKQLRFIDGTVNLIDPQLTSREGLEHLRSLRKALLDLRRLLANGNSGGGAARGRIRPCWAQANRVYEWGITTLPANQRTYGEILRAARMDRTAPAVRLPANAAAFAQYVRAYRKAGGLPSHRYMRRSGRA